jgi:hypothetical protein
MNAVQRLEAVLGITLDDEARQIVFEAVVEAFCIGESHRSMREGTLEAAEAAADSTYVIGPTDKA